ncbi:PREDICTED: platelet glycoprotein 4 [Cyprinodon variegatus]|uniref:platelet glycoprotein 4 n=1 Tax=Cyprinodon variegatus TaxID=28743 RepID=UPI0007427981|nr:PREDICTED: platelet glycoprotein 4 [Cyprinodon variegatus]
MGCCNRRCGLIAGAVVGVLVAILGGILIPVGDNIIKGTVKQEAVIEPGTTAYENWAAAGVKVYRQFWLFEVMNPLEVLDYGAAPVVIERGPYTYMTRYLAKDNVTFHENDTVSFLLPNGAIFEPSMSVGTEEDNITSLNLAVAGAYSVVPPELHILIDKMIYSTNSSLFQRRTVKELLWGYNDPILKQFVGFFPDYNKTYDGYYNVFTGKDDITKVGQIDMWRQSRSLGFWNDTYCDMINGTDASSFAPFVDKEEPLFFFSSDICRSVSASYEQTVNLKGIDVYRYSLLPSTLASPVDNPDNKCFCSNMKVTKNCTLAGVLDVSTCQQGQPIYISLPHFLHGSESLVKDVLGLNPNEEHHKTFLDVEPTTGFTLNFAKRIQVNMMYGPSDVITVLKNVKDFTILPLVWLNETATLDDETADMFKKELLSRIQMLETAEYSLIGVGAAIFLMCIIAYLIVRKSHNQSKVA